MLSLVGIYQNGYLTLDNDYKTEKPVKVIVTFLEDIDSSSEEGLTLSDFSFSESRKNLDNFSGSFADAVIDERDEER